jgi:hypothetical protein
MVKFNWSWYHFIPERCGECGKLGFGRRFVPIFRRFTEEDAVSSVWEWAFWWGPLHVRREVPESERFARLEAHRAEMRRRYA